MLLGDSGPACARRGGTGSDSTGIGLLELLVGGNGFGEWGRAKAPRMSALRDCKCDPSAVAPVAARRERGDKGKE